MTQVSLDPDGMSEASQRARETMARIERESAQRDQDRREGRKVGKLSHSLHEKLRSCNPQQLKRVIKLSRQYLKEHKHAPAFRDFPNRRHARVLAHVEHKNMRYCLEVHPCSKANCRKCPHGPYIYSYHRDGQYFPLKYHGSTFTRLPRKVRDAFRPIVAEYKARAIQAGQTRRASTLKAVTESAPRARALEPGRDRHSQTAG